MVFFSYFQGNSENAGRKKGAMPHVTMEKTPRSNGELKKKC